MDLEKVGLQNITNQGTKERTGYVEGAKCAKCGSIKIKAEDYQDEKCGWVFFKCEDCGNEWIADDYRDLDHTVESPWG